VDVKYKLIRSYAVTDAALHDSNMFEQLLADNMNKDVWADSAYRSADRLEKLAQDGFREHIQRKGRGNRPLKPREQEGNKTKAKIRSRVEQVFGVQAQRAGNLLLRTISA
jgi:transposase, IS5 family